MIYVFEEDINGPIKIGTTSNPAKRKKTLQSGNSKPLNLIMAFEGGCSLENKIHKDLSKYRIREDGEWFSRNDAVFKYLNELSPVEPKTEWREGNEYIVLWRNTEESPTDYCPFCGKRHTHGQGDGHRTEHCAFGNDTFTRKSDGKIFKQSQGYIVRTKNWGTQHLFLCHAQGRNKGSCHWICDCKTRHLPTATLYSRLKKHLSNNIINVYNIVV